MYGNQIVSLLSTKTIKAEMFYQDIKHSKSICFLKNTKPIKKSENPLIVDMFNCTLQKTAQSLVIGGVSYNSTITPTLGNLFYTPSTIKVEVRKKGTPVKNSKVYLLDMNMICVGQTTTDDNGIAYFFNRPSEYLYTVISEDSKGEYVSTVVSRLKGDV